MAIQDNKLNYLRTKAGMSLQKLSDILREKYTITVSPSQLNYYEKGERSPRNQEVWESLAEIFHVPVSVLLGYDEMINTVGSQKLIEKFKSMSDEEFAQFSQTEEAKEIYQSLKEIDKINQKENREQYRQTLIGDIQGLLEGLDTDDLEVVYSIVERLYFSEYTLSQELEQKRQELISHYKNNKRESNLIIKNKHS